MKNTLKLELDDAIFPAFASCPRGLEAHLAGELAELGAFLCEPTGGGAEFEASWPTLLRINLWSRLAGRVGLRIAQAPCRSEEDLYRFALRQPWKQWFGIDQTFRVDVNNIGTRLPNLRFAQLRIKDAICDAFRQETGERPSVRIDAPDVRVFAGLGVEQVSLYIDLSGENLFKRGWRAAKGYAPLKENLAAGLLAISAWQPAQPLLDPFCGSGTIVIEAACLAADKAPGLDRSFGFEKLKPHRVDLWEPIWTQAAKRFETGIAQACANDALHIHGSDVTRKLIDIARENAIQAGLEPLLAAGRLQFQQIDARAALPPAATPGLLLTNPPYGERLRAKGYDDSAHREEAIDGDEGVLDDERYQALFTQLGSQLKRQFAGWRVAILSGDLEVRRALGLSPKRRTPLYNGDIECRLFEFPMTAGSFRPA
ncbi:MAG: class I SAM-dependent RNA methyltransferase [Burkholderiaceae bacterium]|jgi:putative N6-adenine-specific DNA methylase